MLDLWQGRSHCSVVSETTQHQFGHIDEDDSESVEEATENV